MKNKEKKKKQSLVEKAKLFVKDYRNTGDYLYDYLLLYANLWIDHCV